MKQSVKRTILWLVLVLAVAAVLHLTGNRQKQPGYVEADSGSRIVMGTFARVLVVAKDKESAVETIEAAFTELKRIEDLMTVHRESQVTLINDEASKHPVPVDNDIFYILSESIRYGELSGGSFDITVGPLVQLWKTAADTNTPPTQEQLENAQRKVGYKKLVLDPNNQTVFFAVEGMSIDLGAIAKGYAVDKVVEKIRQPSILGAMVDLGGNIRCFGKPAGGKEFWNIGIQDPHVEASDVTTQKTIFTLAFKDEAVATSGDYRRFNTIGGVRHSHIIDPNHPEAESKLNSVTIIAPTALTADALSTAVTVMGAEKGMSLIESLENTEAILITPSGKITKSPGADKFIKY
ncbi:MAG: FAD:protein FMN transferase [Phycisphaerae bacterium]|nr:FAD:protein FMN transferase [Phycisphaerae bacterium]